MIIFLVILYGLIIGSFLNVVIYRVPNGMSIVKPGSACPNCGHKIKWYENIPVFSFLFLSAKCSDCKSPISWRYPGVEALTSAVLLGLYLHFGMSLDFLFYSIFIILVLIITFIDIDHMIIPNVMLLIAIIPGLYPVIRYGVGNDDFMLYVWGCLGLGLGFLAIQFLGKIALKQDALGMGDVKYAFLLGLIFGWKAGLLVVSLAFITSASAAVFLMIIGKSALGRKLPFGPFLGIGAYVTLLAGSEIINWYLKLVMNKG